jgi:hypothetical protein
MCGGLLRQSATTRLPGRLCDKSSLRQSIKYVRLRHDGLRRTIGVWSILAPVHDRLNGFRRVHWTLQNFLDTLFVSSLGFNHVGLELVERIFVGFAFHELQIFFAQVLLADTGHGRGSIS